MADPITSREAMASAVLEKTPTTGQPEHVVAAKKLREKMEKQGDRSVLEELQERKPIDAGRVSRVIEGNIGVDRRADGKKVLNTAEKSRKDRAETIAQLNQEYVDKGYDQLDPGKQDILRSDVESTLMAWPDAQALLTDPSVGPNERKAIIEDILKNPAMMAQVRRGFEGVLSKQLKDTVSEAKKAFDEVKNAEDEKAAELKKTQQEKNDTDDELKKHEAIGATKGAKFQELEKINADLQVINSEIRQLSDDRQDKMDNIRDLDRRRKQILFRDPGADVSTYDSAISNARSEIRQLDRDIADRQQKLDRKTELENEKASLQKKSKELEEKKGQLEQQVKELRQQRLSAQAELGKVRLDRVDEEQAFVVALNDVVSEAAMQHIMDRIAKAEQAQKELIAEAKANAKDPAEVALLEQFGKRWDTSYKSVLLGKETTKPNDVMIKEDFGTLVQSGPDILIRIMLQNGGMSNTDVDAKMQDESFMKNARAQVAEKVIGKKIQQGKISENEAAKIWDAPWGKDAINKAIESNVQLKAKLRELKAGGHVKGTLAQEMLQDLREHKGLGGLTLAALLLLLLSPIAAAGVAGVGIVGKTAAEVARS